MAWARSPQRVRARASGQAEACRPRTRPVRTAPPPRALVRTRTEWRRSRAAVGQRPHAS
jgi:hypothetical protein